MTDAAPRPGSDNILVSGLGKTGTSGVYTSVKNALAGTPDLPAYRTMFEPSGPTSQLLRLLDKHPELIDDLR